MLKTGISIPKNVCDKGLSIPHYGAIVVNAACRIGQNVSRDCNSLKQSDLRDWLNTFTGATQPLELCQSKQPPFTPVSCPPVLGGFGFDMLTRKTDFLDGGWVYRVHLFTRDTKHHRV